MPSNDSNVLPEAEQNPEVLRQLELSRQVTNWLDGYRLKKSISDPNRKYRAEQSVHAVIVQWIRYVTSLEEANIKHKVEYFDGGAQEHVWQSIQDHLSDWSDLHDSALKRARLDGDLRAASDAIMESREALKRERKRDLQDPSVRQVEQA